MTVVLALGAYACTTSVGPASEDVEFQVAAAALADAAGADMEVVMLHDALEARTEQFPDSVAWTSTTEGSGRSRPRLPDLVGSYWHANREARPLPYPLSVPGRRVRLVDGRAEGSLDEGGTIHFVSRVGFGTAGDSALVFVDAPCGNLCGGGVLALYVRTPEGWRRAATLQETTY